MFVKLKSIKNKLTWWGREIYKFLARFNAHPSLRLLIGRFRFFWFSRTRGLMTMDGISSRINTVSHNLLAFRNFSNDFSMPRMEWLIKAATSVEVVSKNSRFLIIGPRTESDLLRLIGDGYANVRGLDLISYSPLITLGDMHHMPFSDCEFDVIICGWTISYSTHPTLLANEIGRVAKDGALIAIGLEHLTDQPRQINGGLLDPSEDARRINTVDQILDLFGSKVKQVFFRHDAPLRSMDRADLVSLNGLDSSQVMTVFMI